MNGWLRISFVAWVAWTWWAYAYFDEMFGWDAATRLTLIGVSLGPPAVGRWIWRGFKPKTAR